MMAENRHEPLMLPENCDEKNGGAFCEHWERPPNVPRGICLRGALSRLLPKIGDDNFADRTYTAKERDYVEDIVNYILERAFSESPFLDEYGKNLSIPQMLAIVNKEAVDTYDYLSIRNRITTLGRYVSLREQTARIRGVPYSSIDYSEVYSQNNLADHLLSYETLPYYPPYSEKEERDAIERAIERVLASSLAGVPFAEKYGENLTVLEMMTILSRDANDDLSRAFLIINTPYRILDSSYLGPHPDTPQSKSRIGKDTDAPSDNATKKDV